MFSGRRALWDQGEIKRNTDDVKKKPRDDCVGDSDLVNVAAFQLGEEIWKIHFLLLVRSDLFLA
jgi:hypothetical protein